MSQIKKYLLPKKSQYFFSIVNKQPFFLTRSSVNDKYLLLSNILEFKKQKHLLSIDTTKNNLFNYLSSIVNTALKKKKLFVRGLGMKVRFLQDVRFLELKLGYSHVVNVFIDNRVQVTAIKSTVILESKDLVYMGNIINKIRSFKKPDAYKGSGIWLKGEKRVLKPIKKT